MWLTQCKIQAIFFFWYRLTYTIQKQTHNMVFVIEWIINWIKNVIRFIQCYSFIFYFFVGINEYTFFIISCRNKKKATIIKIPGFMRIIIIMKPLNKIFLWIINTLFIEFRQITFFPYTINLIIRNFFCGVHNNICLIWQNTFWKNHVWIIHFEITIFFIIHTFFLNYITTQNTLKFFFLLNSVIS